MEGNDDGQDSNKNKLRFKVKIIDSDIQDDSVRKRLSFAEVAVSRMLCRRLCRMLKFQNIKCIALDKSEKRKEKKAQIETKRIAEEEEAANDKEEEKEAEDDENVEKEVEKNDVELANEAAIKSVEELFAILEGLTKTVVDESLSEMNKEAKKKKREEQIEKKRKLEPKKKEKQDKDSNQKKSDENEKVNMEESAGEESEVEKHEDEIGIETESEDEEEMVKKTKKGKKCIKRKEPSTSKNKNMNKAEEEEENYSNSKDEEELKKGSIKATRQKVNDILGIPIGNRKLQDLDKRTDIEPFITEWEAQYNHLGKPTPQGIALQMLGKVHPSDNGSQPRCELYLDELTLGATGVITVMIYHSWDVHTLTGRYVSTDFVMSDVKGNAIYSNAKANVAHNFLKLKEGLVYCLKIFVVQSNKEEYRIFRNHTYMIELDGATFVRKASVKSDKLYLSSGSSTQILDDPQIHALHALLLENSEDEVSLSQAAVHADYSQAKEETLENLLIWAQNRKNDVSFSLLAIKLPYIVKNYLERLLTLARVYGFWKHVSMLDRLEIHCYLEMAYVLKYRKFLVSISKAALCIQGSMTPTSRLLLLLPLLVVMVMLLPKARAQHRYSTTWDLLLPLANNISLNTTHYIRQVDAERYFLWNYHTSSNSKRLSTVIKELNEELTQWEYINNRINMIGLFLFDMKNIDRYSVLLETPSKVLQMTCNALLLEYQPN
ncbi:hypothetical protein Tco_1003496 [Tanacetum coccineum]|uniref:DUF223 domain-containing protein n=1 Tax=Tanacetum coccineum TaxID=301880 RepID=A0ABQ5FAM0_9ASTR